MTKSILETAVKKGAAKLNDAQKAIVFAQFADYKSNKARILQIENALSLLSSQHKDGKSEIAYAASLVNERTQLIDVNGRIAARLFDQLSDR